MSMRHRIRTLTFAGGIFALLFTAAVPVALAEGESVLVTNGESQIGDFPTGTFGVPYTSWRIDTTTVNDAVVTEIPVDFIGPSNETIDDASDWEELISESDDDDYVQIPFDGGFETFFNGTVYESAYVSSNTYLTFGEGSDEYSSLAADNPAIPGVHLCAADNSYQRVMYRFDDDDTLRVRYEGTDSTSGTVGSPTIIYEAVLYNGANYFDVHIGRNERCSPLIGTPTISGAPGVGHELTGAIGDWDSIEGTVFDYEWQRSEDGETDWEAIPEASGESYALTEDDLDQYVRFVVTASLEEDSVTVPSSATDQIGTIPVLEDSDEDTYYEISSCEELQSARYYLNRNYELTDTIDCSETNPDHDSFENHGTWGDDQGFFPIGDDVNPYAFEFDGGGYRISNLFIDRPDTNYVGLFGVIGEAGYVHSLELEDVDITGADSVGSLAGALNGTAEDLVASGEVAGDEQIGGLVGSHIEPIGEGGSSPLVYTWNGEEYEYVADVGHQLPRTINGEDPAPIDQSSLVPVDGKYSVKISQEYNEIVYFDELSLMTFDHEPGHTVATTPVRALSDEFYTVSTTPAHPLQSCTDQYDNDCVDELGSFDDSWGYIDPSNVNYFDMNFGDLSDADRKLLIVRGAVSWTIPGGTDRFVQVKDAEGNWVDAYTRSDLATLDEVPRLLVIDLTDKFVGDTYDVRISFDRTSINYVAMDTSAPVEYTVTTLAPTSADLGFRGYTAVETVPFWDHDYEVVSPTPPELFAPQTGNFTKYGDVVPLLLERDDHYVVMHHGDHMDITFDYEAPAEGLERSFVLYNWASFKHANIGALGRTVDPLPYEGMGTYTADTVYPLTPENIEYLETWNTREITGATGGGSTIIDSFSSVDVSGFASVGGLVGYNEKLITGSVAVGDVYAESGDAGGLVGSNENGGEIIESIALGDVSSDPDESSRTGGLVGDNRDESSITRSYALGDVNGDTDVGGLVGVNSSASITNSYARGDVSGFSNVGGFAGTNNGSIDDSYSTGAPTGDSFGGFLSNNTEGSVSDSFWDILTSGTESSAEGTGLETTDMTDIDTYLGAFWDFEGVWAMEESMNDGYPILQNSPALELSVETDDATPSRSSATLNGDVTVEGYGTVTVRGFQYGESTEYDEEIGEEGDFTAEEYSLVASGLDCNTVYHVRAFAISGETTVYGYDETFETRSCGGGSSGPVVVIQQPIDDFGDNTPPEEEEETEEEDETLPDEDATEEDEDEDEAAPPASFNSYTGRWEAPSSGTSGPSPFTGEMEEISLVDEGWFIRGENYDTVYLVSEDGVRRPFWDAQTFLTWADSWEDVIWVTDATLATLQLGDVMLPKPGVVLVKIQDVAAVHAIRDEAAGPTLGWIPDEPTATTVFGTFWADFVIDLPPTIFGHFLTGDPVESTEVWDLSIMKTRASLNQ